MIGGLATPLHLAANLLAVFASAGMAVVVLNRPGEPVEGRPRALSELLLAAGWIAIAVGHALDGALVQTAATVIPWLIAGGLVAVAVSVGSLRAPVPAGGEQTAASARRRPRAAVAAPALTAQGLQITAAVTGALAAMVAGVRVLLTGRGTIALGSGLLIWGAARAMVPTNPRAAAWITVVGALLLGLWLWQASATRLLAKLVTAFIGSLLGVVVLLAVVLSTLGSTSLVEDEVSNLSNTAGEVAQTVAESWPRQAIERAGTLAQLPQIIRQLVDGGSELGLQRLRETLANDQDFLAILDPQGRVVMSTAQLDVLEEQSFLLSLSGSEVVDRLVDGQREAGGLLTVGGNVVALGGAAVLESEEQRPEDDPIYLVVAGRMADDVWVAQAASQLPMELILTVGEELSAASGEIAGVPAEQVVRELRAAREGSSVVISGVELFSASAPLVQPSSVEELGRVIAVRSAEVLAQVERDQTRQLFVVTLLGGLLAGAVVGAVSGRLVAPIRRLTAAAASVREGDLDTQADVGSADEVGELGRTFNEMTRSLAAQSAQLRSAADEQARLRARLETLNASMSDGLIAVDADGRIALFNPAAERLVGRPAADVLGRPLQDVLVGTGPSGDISAADALGAPDSERAGAVQVLLEAVDRTITPTAVTAAPVRDESGAVLGRVFVLRDVKREVELERMKSEFLSNVSHELRTPLTPIKGYADVLARRDVGPEETRQFASQILESTARLERIIAMIVDFAALDSGRMQPRIVETDVGDIVSLVLDRWRERQPQRTFTLRLARGLPKVRVDPKMLSRCLDELIDNAVKFSPGGEAITVSARMAGNGDGPRVQLSVRDRGVGIELDAAANLFSDFYQADGSETRHFGGLGLGLALVRRIVDALDGDASIESAPGQGATVNVLLPAAER